MKKVFFAGLIVVLLGAVTAIVLRKSQADRQAASRQSSGAATSSATEPPPPPVTVSPMLSDSPPDSSQSNSLALDLPNAPKTAGTGEPKNPGGKNKDPLTDPLARVALSLVGADLDAELYWVSAINDPTLPADERKDLIEDLNEEGFADPKHPSPEELPLILSRLALIEELWPWAMDRTNWEAFDEAYKDLLNLLEALKGGGNLLN